MSHKAAIPNEQVIPRFETDVFNENPDAQFMFGKIAVGSTVVPGFEDVYDNYLRLRARVYAHQTGMISVERVRDDGTETDEDDVRSVHMAVVENMGSHARVVGSMRIIEKSLTNPEELPIHDFFGKVLDRSGLVEVVENSNVQATEISRYICRHEDRKVQRTIKWPLFKLAVGHIMATADKAPTYAVVEEFLERDLRINGVSLDRIAEPKFVPEYNDANLAVKIDVPDLAVKLGIDGNADPNPYTPSRADAQFIPRVVPGLRAAV